MSGKTVAIIGAGISGLMAAKESVGHGLCPTIFEKSDGLGGLWRKGLWRNFKTDIVKFNCAFNCKRWASAVETWPNKSRILQYIQEFAEEFNLEQYIQFNSTVKQCSQNGDGTWTVKVTDGAEGRIQIFDFLIVANGFNSIPKQPTIPGLETFTGTHFHSVHYDYIDHLENRYQRVLVVGGNFSGCEIANDIAMNSKAEVMQIVHSTGRRISSITSFSSSLYLSPMDLMRFSAFAKDLEAVSNQGEKSDFMHKMANSVLTYEQSSEFMTIKRAKENAYKTMNKEYMNNTVNGRIKVYTDPVIRVAGPDVILENGAVLNPDLIIFATGYLTDLPFFSESEKKKLMYVQTDPNTPLILFYNVLCPTIQNLAFVGFSKGIFFPLIELQAKYIAGVFSGEQSLPTVEKMTAFVNKERDIRLLKARLPILPLENLSLTVDFASLAEANPLTDDLKRDYPLVYESFMNRPFNACMFNFSGRDARPVQAFEVYTEMLKEYGDQLSSDEQSEFLAYIASVDRNFDLFRNFFDGEFTFERVVQDFIKKTSDVVSGDATFKTESLLEKTLNQTPLKKGDLKDHLSTMRLSFDSKSDKLFIHAKDLRFSLDFRKNHLHSASTIESEDDFAHLEIAVNSLSKFTLSFQVKNEQVDQRITTKYKRHKNA